MSTIRPFWPVLLGIVLALATLPTASAQNEGALRFSDVNRLIDDGQSPEQVLMQLRERGIDFRLTSTTEGRLKDWGFTKEHLDLIRRMIAGEAVVLPGDEPLEEAPPNAPPGNLAPTFPVGYTMTEQEIELQRRLIRSAIDSTRVRYEIIECDRFTLLCSKQRSEAMGEAIRNLERQIVATFPPAIANATHKQSLVLVVCNSQSELQTLVNAVIQNYREVWPDYAKDSPTTRWRHWMNGTLVGVDGSFFTETQTALRPLSVGVGHAIMRHLGGNATPDCLTLGFGSCIEQLAMGSPATLSTPTIYDNPDDMPDWAADVQWQLEGNRMPSLVEVFKYDVDRMQAAEFSVTWSLTMYLQKSPDKLQRATHRMRVDRTPPLEAILTEYEMDAATLQRRWLESIPGL